MTVLGSRRIIAGLVLTSAGSLRIKISITRGFAVQQFHSCAFVVVSLGVMGTAASGLVMALRPRAPSLEWLSSAGAVGMFVGYVTINFVPFDSYVVIWDRRQLAVLLIYFLAASVPFFFTGWVTGACLAEAGESASRPYAANLAGAGLGCVVALGAHTIHGDERIRAARDSRGTRRLRPAGCPPAESVALQTSFECAALPRCAPDSHPLRDGGATGCGRERKHPCLSWPEPERGRCPAFPGGVVHRWRRTVAGYTHRCGFAGGERTCHAPPWWTGLPPSARGRGDDPGAWRGVGGVGGVGARSQQGLRRVRRAAGNGGAQWAVLGILPESHSRSAHRGTESIHSWGASFRSRFRRRGLRPEQPIPPGHCRRVLAERRVHAHPRGYPRGLHAVEWRWSVDHDPLARHSAQ